MDLGLQGARCIIPGGSRGIGLATAKALVAEGARVAVCGREAATVARAVAQLGAKTEGAAVDVRNAGAYREWLRSIATTLGGCDIFIPFASAGATPADDAGWQASLEFDLLAFDRGLEELQPWLRASDRGSVVAVASTVAVENPVQAPRYASLKAALIVNAAAWAQQLAPYLVRVNCVSPGPVQFAGGVWDSIEQADPDLYATIRGEIPIGRMGTAEELARLITFVASPACSYMVGSNVVADGGLTRRVGF